MTRAQKSYHSSIRALRKEFGLTHKQAISARRGMAERLGRAPLGKDIAAHPRIAKQEATKTSKRLQREAKERPAKERPAKERPAKEKSVLKDLSGWFSYLDNYDGLFEDIEYDDTAEYIK